MSPIVIAPFSNSDVRDWPIDHYRALIQRLVETGSDRFHIVGADSQAIRARDLVRSFDATRVINDCGRLAWMASVALIRDARCVIGNNSGIAHLAAMTGVPTICIFGGAHQRAEWRPIGEKVTVVSRALACSPCNLHYAADCAFGVACLDQITPDAVFRAVKALIEPSSQPAVATFA